MASSTEYKKKRGAKPGSIRQPYWSPLEVATLIELRLHTFLDWGETSWQSIATALHTTFPTERTPDKVKAKWRNYETLARKYTANPADYASRNLAEMLPKYDMWLEYQGRRPNIILPASVVIGNPAVPCREEGKNVSTNILDPSVPPPPQAAAATVVAEMKVEVDARSAAASSSTSPPSSPTSSSSTSSTASSSAALRAADEKRAAAGAAAPLPAAATAAAHTHAHARKRHRPAAQLAAERFAPMVAVMDKYFEAFQKMHREQLEADQKQNQQILQQNQQLIDAIVNSLRPAPAKTPS